MELDFGREIEDFRTELRVGGVESVRPDGLAELCDWRLQRYGGSHWTEQQWDFEDHPLFKKWEGALLYAATRLPRLPV